MKDGSYLMQASERGRERGREGGREGGTEGGRERGRGERERGREGGREGEMEGGGEGGRRKKEKCTRLTGHKSHRDLIMQIRRFPFAPFFSVWREITGVAQRGAAVAWPAHFVVSPPNYCRFLHTHTVDARARAFPNAARESPMGSVFIPSLPAKKHGHMCLAFFSVFHRRLRHLKHISIRKSRWHCGQ